jgi:hypothetical protein
MGCPIEPFTRHFRPFAAQLLNVGSGSGIIGLYAQKRERGSPPSFRVLEAVQKKGRPEERGA